MTSQPTARPAAAPTSHHVDVAGARVYYEVRGEGPLLLVVGQPMTSGPFGPVADVLARERTVVTYDPRGVGRSSVEERARPITPEDEADDLAAVIDAVGGGPADVVGSSGGAVAGLALVARHPHHVRRLVAHEPPLAELLPDAPHIRAAVDGVRGTFEAAGAGPAWGAFASLVMHDGLVGPEGVPPAAWAPGAPEPAGADPAEPPAAEADSPHGGPDDETFFLRMLVPFTRWSAPLEPLRAHGGVRVAIGAASCQEIAARATRALADRLGVVPVALPGGHAGFLDDAEAFAAAVRLVLDAPA